MEQQNKKSRADIESLIQDWESDPCFDLEKVEGFEEHYDELRAHSEKMTAHWQQLTEQRLRLANLTRPNDPAAPHTEWTHNDNDVLCANASFKGFTKREYIAVKAMQALCTPLNNDDTPRLWQYNMLAECAVKAADALIEALNKAE